MLYSNAVASSALAVKAAPRPSASVPLSGKVRPPARAASGRQTRSVTTTRRNDSPNSYRLRAAGRAGGLARERIGARRAFVQIVARAAHDSETLDEGELQAVREADAGVAAGEQRRAGAG